MSSAERVVLVVDRPELVNCPRLRYAAELVFELLLGQSLESIVATRPEPASLRVVHYGIRRTQGDETSWIPDAGYFGENRLPHHEGVWPEGGRQPFPVREGFDILASAFWAASRAEEVAASSEVLDDHGRFPSSASLLTQRGWLNEPAVERWVADWAEQEWGEVPLKDAAYRALLGVDVDSAFAYEGRSLIRTIGATMKDVLRGDVRRLKQRVSVLTGRMQDPYDTYDWIASQHAECGLPVRYFFLMAKRGRFDRGLSPNSRALTRLIRKLAKSANIGLHPGYAAHQSPTSDRLAEEASRLSSALGGDPPSVSHTRQHYLLQRPPSSWRRLAEAGLSHDHSLGYADRSGFRSGFARPYPAYDLVRDEQLPLTLHPVMVMDATLMRYEKRTPEQAVERIGALARIVKEVQGELGIVWHNESVSEEEPWRGWRWVYQEMLRIVR